MKWLKTYLREVTGETWTFVGLLTAYFTLDGSAKKVTGMLIMVGAFVWLVTLPLRQDDKKD
jgi:hypothetical protein